MNSTSFHGWWDFDYSIVNGKEQRHSLTRIIRTEDEVTLMINCNNRTVQLGHHRMNRTVNMSINLRLCVFPWKIIILLPGKNDCVRILH